MFTLTIEILCFIAGLAVAAFIGVGINYEGGIREFCRVKGNIIMFFIFAVFAALYICAGGAIDRQRSELKSLKAASAAKAPADVNPPIEDETEKAAALIASDPNITTIP